MRTLAVVTLYHPSPQVGENIASYATGVDGLFIWNNTPPGSPEPALPDVVQAKVVRYRRGENVGIGQPLDEAARMAMEEGYTHLLTMDQDSRFIPDSFRAYLEEAVRLDAEEDKPVVYVPLVNRLPFDGSPQVVDSFITSGTLFPVGTLRAVGPFCAKLVIDGIDLEYSFRLRAMEGQIMRLPQGSLQHALGYPLRKRFLWWMPVSLNYPPARVYYIARNFLYLKKQYPQYVNPSTVRKLVWQRPFYILFIEKRKVAKLRAWVRGVADGWRCRF